MNTKNIVKTGLFTLALGLSLNSCMNLEPKATTADNVVWGSASNIQLFANQFYGYTRDFTSNTPYQCGLADGPHSDYRSDLVCTNTPNTYSMGTNGVSSTDNNYTSLYTRIYYTNLLLQNASSFSPQSSVTQPLGEAYFFRAYLYFELVQLYGDAIIVTEPIDMDSEKLTASQNTRDEVIDLCISDLRQAIGLLHSKPSETGRVSSIVAQAFLSRVALYEGTWQKFHNGGGANTQRSLDLLYIARDAAKAVIDSKQYELFYNASLVNSNVSNINQSYRYLFTLEDVLCNPASKTKSDNKEFILSHRHRLDDALGMNLSGAMANNTCWVTRKMANMYLSANGRPIENNTEFGGYATRISEFQNRDTRMDNSMMWYGEKYWLNKGHVRTYFTDADDATATTANVQKNSGYATQKYVVERAVDDGKESPDFPVIRYAEILLNYTEALYEISDGIVDPTGDLENGLKYLNLVRRRSNPTMPKLTSDFCTTYNLDMRTEIRRERTVELFLEGFRIDDLKRWKTAETEMPMTQYGIQWKGTQFETEWTNTGKDYDPTNNCLILYSGRKWEQKNYLYPLPTEQIKYNPNLKQNPGW